MNKKPACEECGGKKAHQRSCSESTYVPPTFDEKVKIAAEGIHDAADYWLSLIEKEKELREKGEWPEDAYSITGEFYSRRVSGSPRLVLRPPQM